MLKNTYPKKQLLPRYNAMRDKDIMNYVFQPGSIAIIGASSDGEKEKSVGWTGRLLQFGYEGTIYPINPKAKEILGLKAYTSVKDISEPIDYAIITLPRHLVPNALKDCMTRGVRVVHIYTAGFSETGEREGIELQKEIIKIIKGSDTRVIGPNCMGVYSPMGGLSFDIRFAHETGPIAFFSQTGVGGRRFLNLAIGRGHRFSMAVSYGNGIDLNIADFLEYASQDHETKIVFIYIEGLRDGRRFFDVLKACNRVKPVLLLKAGMSNSGASAVSSHTASLCGTKKVWEALFKQTGTIRVECMEEAVDLLVAVRLLPQITGRNIGLVGRGGGIGVICADMCEREGLIIPPLSTETRRKLARITPSTSGSSIRNPVEIGLGISGVSERYVEGLEIVASDPQIDCLITFINPEDYVHYGIEGWIDDLMKAFIEAKKNLSKPFCVVILQGTSIEIFEITLQLQSQCQKEEIACFLSMDAAIRAVAKTISYHEFKEE